MSIPSGWPPGPEAEPRRVAPLFPLPKVFLYPSVVLPLHIFEPRYRQMIDDLLDRQGWLVISPIQAGYEDQAAGAPPVYPVGGLGEIIKHTRLADGRYLITLAGISRVRLEEIEVDTPYRQVRFEPVSEVQPGPGEAERLQDELREAILQRSDQFLNLPSDLPAGPLSDLLLQNLDLPVDSMSRAYAEPVVLKRAEFALAQHRARS